MSEKTKRSPVAELIFKALTFADWAAGQGILPADDALDAPEEFLFAYARAADDDEVEKLPDTIASYVSDLQSRLEKAEAERDDYQAMFEGTQGQLTTARDDTIDVAQSYLRAQPSFGDGRWASNHLEALKSSPPTPDQGGER